MSERGLHVVFGTGQVGSAVAAHLARTGLSVRSVSRHRPATLADGVDWHAADVADPEAASAAAKGATVVYQCLNAPYARWPRDFPPLQRAVLTAAERTNALLVTLENVYAYGPTGGKPMTEDLPLAATTVKGRARAAMTQELQAAAAAGQIQIAIGRASDFFGAGVTGSTVGERVFANALAGRQVDFIGNPELLHSYSYVPDIAAGLGTLGTDARAIGQVWHLPGPPTVTTRAFLDVLADVVGHPVKIRTTPKLVLRALGLVNPLIRELAEMEYEFEEPFVLDTSKYEATFGPAGTPLMDAMPCRHVQEPVRPELHRSWPARAGARQRDEQPDCRLGLAPTHRSDALGQQAAPPPARSRRGVRPRLPSACPPNRYRRHRHARSIPSGERNRRAGDRRECVDHLIILDEQHLLSALREFVAYSNAERPHRTLGLQTPQVPLRPMTGPIRSRPVLNGLHHVYERAA